MTEAGWTSEKPTAAGFWWWRQSDRVKYLYIVEVDSEMNVWFHGKEDESRVDYLTGEWFGPITPTDRQQGRVEGLREYREVVARELQLDHNNHPTRFKASIIEALDKADFEVAKIAQPAQDEKGVGDGKESNVHL